MLIKVPHVIGLSRQDKLCPSITGVDLFIMASMYRYIYWPLSANSSCFTYTNRKKNSN